ncbi:hypothetical protein B0H17DRAFT_1139111 [Mycena rosella]|uniref:DNA 3'-5' helicase n=1 Tax=Mycena rosella TaxID=1033263 RepID=A0AAD7D8D2_MYCRO|nr:hypothetical protein B0H17DRAFT_1139111 [Mycena rosella]
MGGTAFLLALFLLLLSHICDAFKFYSEPGFTLVRKILLAVLPTFEPHHYQLDGICKVFDGIDLVAVIPTGSGKTAYLFLTIIVMIAISKLRHSVPLYISLSTRQSLLFVPPTQLNSRCLCRFQDENMAKIGVAALTINADTVAAARIRSEDLWIRARTGIAMLILGPEQLILQGFRDLLAFEPFYNCIGYMRARLRPGIPVIGLTATLLADLMIQNTIFAFLGVNRGEFYLIRRSNARHDIRILFRNCIRGLTVAYSLRLRGSSNGSDKTLIFGNTISLVHRLKTYLNGLLPNDPDRDVRIRTHTGLNWPDDKLATLTDIANDPKCQIILATNGLAQGNDIRVIKTDIQIGEPESVEMYVQKPGRARPGIQNPRAIFYISSNHMELAAKIVQQSDVENDADAKKAGSSVTRMSRPTAEILTAKCKPVEQDHHFDNPSSNSPCLCKTCTANPLAPRPAHCLCSGCTPETSSHELYQPPPKKKQVASDIPAGKRLTKVMKEAGRSRLEDFRVTVWLEASDRTMGLTPLAEFLPDIIITQLLDRFAKISTMAHLSPFISQIVGLEGYHTQLLILASILASILDSVPL